MKHVSILHHCRRLPVVVTALIAPALAQAGDLGIAGKLSSLGYGAEVDYRISERFNIRGQFNRYRYDDTFEEDEIDYDGTLDLESLGVLIDWRPFGGPFRVTLGGFQVDNEITGVGSGTGTYEIGDGSYTVTPGDDLKIDATMTLGDGFKPYVGIGLGHDPATEKGLLLSLDIGVLYQGSPSVDLNATGTATDDSSGLTVDFSTDPTVQAEVRKEEKELEDDLGNFDFYPVISFGIGYRF